MSALEKTAALKDKPNLNEVLLSWKSPSHPFVKRSPVYYQTLAALTFLFVVIVYFFHDYLLIGVILSIAFVVYIVSSVPPVEVKHEITPLGFRNAGRLFRWIELYAFWFEKKWNKEVLVIQTQLATPTQIRAVLENISKEQLKEVVGKYLLYLESPPKTFTDRFSHWLSKKIPLDTTK